MANRTNAAGKAVDGDARGDGAQRKAPYWNMHGGAPGRAPAMKHDLHTDKNGSAAFDRLNDPYARFHSKDGGAA